ncbi:MAG: lipoprotein [Methylophilus sp.]|nr:lipoprotein [Methylophilus sp.]
MRNFYTKVATMSLLCMLISACGTKGPLYIPEQQYPQDPPQEAPTAPAQNN